MLGWNLTSLNRTLTLLGQPALWERAARCPCRSTRTGGADPTCAVCGGAGVVWTEALPATVGIQSMHTRREFGAFSEWERGDVLCILPTDTPAFAAGEYDRITLTQAQLRMTHILTRGLTDALKYRHPERVLEVWAIVANAKVLATEGVDFTRAGQTITWLTATVPVGSQYSISYLAQPEYFVYRELVQDRPHGGRPLPRKVQLRLMELMHRAVA